MSYSEVKVDYGISDVRSTIETVLAKLRSGRCQGFPWDAASVEKWAMARLQRPLQRRHPGVRGIEVGCGLSG